MSDILKAWLVDDVGLQVESFERDFANGYVFGVLFNHFSMQPDFDKLEAKWTPDAMINNFTRLQPTFKRLGIQFDTRTANALMREEPGVASKLLYSIKQNVGQVQKDVKKYQNTGKLGKELGAAVPVTRGLLDAQQHNTLKEPYEQGNQRFFEESMRHLSGNTNQLLESAKLQRFTERHQQYDSNLERMTAEDRARTEAEAAAFRSSLLRQMGTGRSAKSQKLQHDDAIHKAILKRKEDIEKQEQRVERVLSERSHRKKLTEINHASLDVNHGIDAFESNMKRLLKGGAGLDDDDEPPPAASRSPMKSRSLSASTAKLMEDTQQYMAAVSSRRADDAVTKREREARRRKMLVEQQEATSQAERRAQADALFASLSRQSNEEQRLASRLWQLRQEKEVMRDDRALREQQYADRREQDWQETLQRELDLHRSLREQYEAEAAVEAQAWRDAQAARAAEEAAANRSMCEGVAWQVVHLAERVAEYRVRTNSMVPLREYRRWLAMFRNGDPALDEPVIGASEEELSRAHAEDPVTHAIVQDYLNCTGEFVIKLRPPTPPPSAAGEAAAAEEITAIGTNIAIGKAVADLADLCREKPAPKELPAVSFPLRMAVVGAPFSGKTSAAQELARKFRLRLIDPEVLIDEAVKAAQEWNAQQAAAAAPAAAPGILTPSEPATPRPEQAQSAEGGAEASVEPGAAAPVEEGAAPASEEQPAASQPPPAPPRKAALGLLIQAALTEGVDISDDVMVSLVVLAMEETATWTPPPLLDATGKPKSAAKPTKPGSPAEPEPVPGFVVDGFPRTLAQARLMEAQLTGLNLDAELDIIASASVVAPPPKECLPDTSRLLRSGLDAVLVLGLDEEATALKRALGRRVDPEDQRVYHVEFDPPPADNPGLVARLQWVQDPANDASQIQRRLAGYGAEAAALEEWLKRFMKLHRPIDGSGPLADVLASACEVADSILRADDAVVATRLAAEQAQRARVAAEDGQEFAEAARAQAETAAKELLTAKKAELAAQALLVDPKSKNPDPAATQLLKEQSAAKCLEQLRLCKQAAEEAAGFAERAAVSANSSNEAYERALACLGDSQVSVSAEKEANAAAEAANKSRQGAADAAARAEAAKQAADVAVAQAERFAEATAIGPTDVLELAPPAPDPAAEAAAAAAAAAADAPPAVVPVPQPLCGALLEEWHHIERTYLEGLTHGFSGLAEEHALAVAHFERMRVAFRELLSRPDERPALVTRFQQDWNAVDVDVRQMKETQAELVLRSEELRDKLWAICDKKMEEAEAERASLAADTFVNDHTALVAQYFNGMLQVEMDRFFSSLSFMRGFVKAHYNVLHAPDAESERPAPNLLSGEVPADVKDRVDEKSKNVMQFPPAVAALAAKAPKLAVALKVALATVAAVSAELNPDENDPKKKKDTKPPPAKGKKGDVPEEPEVDPKVAEAMKREVLEAGNREIAIMQQRAVLLAERAAAAFEDVAGMAAKSHAQLGEWIKGRYQAECSAAAALERLGKEAAVEGRTLPEDLRMEVDGGALTVDATSRHLPVPEEVPPLPPAEPAPPAALLSTGQMRRLCAKFLDLAPQGFIRVSDAAALLVASTADGTLPAAWHGTGNVQMMNLLRLYDPTHTGYMDWRELGAHLVSAAFPEVMQASCADIADQVQMLAEADSDRDGLVTLDQWRSTQLWFQRKGFVPGVSDSDLEGQYLEVDPDLRKQHFDSAAALKDALWDMFSRPSTSLPEGSAAAAAGAPRLDFVAVLLYLCADRDMSLALRRAFSVVTGSIASTARASPEQVFKVAYPLGFEEGVSIEKSPFDLASVAEAVQEVYLSRGGEPDSTPGISAEQLLYSASGERLVTFLLQRYQWKDVFTTTRL